MKRLILKSEIYKKLYFIFLPINKFKIFIIKKYR